MMLKYDTLSDEAHAALVDCLRVLAARGRAVRLERERQAQQAAPIKPPSRRVAPMRPTTTTARAAQAAQVAPVMGLIATPQG